MRLPLASLFFGLVAGTCGSNYARAQDEQAASGEPVVVFFAWDRPIIDRDAAAQLDALAATLKRSPGVRLALIGHADRSGPEAPNLRSGKKRAEAVHAYLASRGVPGAAMSVMSYGESRPLIATADGVREPQNRRVEVVVTPVAGR
jgi:outer membrane protein OmpA-like peptidoglycan-associated protein